MFNIINDRIQYVENRDVVLEEYSINELIDALQQVNQKILNFEIEKTAELGSLQDTATRLNTMLTQLQSSLVNV